MLREMRGPEGGFYSALDADSEGEEGRFYVWTPDQIREVLGDAGLGDAADEVIALLRRHASAATSRARNILHLRRRRRRAAPPAASTRRAGRSIEARAKRVWPGLDDKRLASWNALAIAALAEAGAVLGRADYLDAARGLRGVRLDTDARRRRAPAAHLQGRRGASSTPTSRTTPSCSRRC